MKAMFDLWNFGNSSGSICAHRKFVPAVDFRPASASCFNFSAAKEVMCALETIAVSRGFIISYNHLCGMSTTGRIQVFEQAYTALLATGRAELGLVEADAGAVLLDMKHYVEIKYRTVFEEICLPMQRAGVAYA